MKKKESRQKKQTGHNVAYLRVSTTAQDNEKNKAAILSFANERRFGNVTFVEEKISGTKPWRERKVGQIIDELGEGDRLFVSELSRLGRSMVDVMSCISSAKEKGISIFDIKNGFELNGRFQGELMAMIFSIAAQIEKDLISARTKEGLVTARAKGTLLGRPKGAGKSKLDIHKEEIVALLKTCSTKKFIALRYKTTPVNLWNWLKKNNLQEFIAKR